MIATSPDSVIRGVPARAFCVKVRPLDLRHSSYAQPDDIYYAAEFLSPDGGAAMLINRVTGASLVRRMVPRNPDREQTRCFANWDAQELGLVRSKDTDTTSRARTEGPTSWWLPTASGTPNTTVLDSASIANILAQHLLDTEQPFVIGSSAEPFRIDTATNAWNRLVARAIRRQRPSALPPLPDSVAYYMHAESVEEVGVQRDTVTVTLKSSYCSKRGTGGFSAGFTSTAYYITRATPWLRALPGASILMAEGMCAPFKAGSGQ
jgi:hypothetical protein